MPSNVEIKARIPDSEFAALRERAAALAARPAEVLRQTDTFFATEKGRLKLREFHNGGGELIYYERPDQSGPKHSSYTRSDCPEPASMREALGRALGVRGVVEKRREVLLAGQTRIYLDEVSGLGSFLELEVVLANGQSVESGERIACDLLKRLGVPAEALESAAYIDLLEEGGV